jgi:hypothetical protein
MKNNTLKTFQARMFVAQMYFQPKPDKKRVTTQTLDLAATNGLAYLCRTITDNEKQYFEGI